MTTSPSPPSSPPPPPPPRSSSPTSFYYHSPSTWWSSFFSSSSSSSSIFGKRRRTRKVSGDQDRPHHRDPHYLYPPHSQYPQGNDNNNNDNNNNDDVDDVVVIHHSGWRRRQKQQEQQQQQQKQKRRSLLRRFIGRRRPRRPCLCGTMVCIVIIIMAYLNVFFYYYGTIPSLSSTTTTTTTVFFDPYRHVTLLMNEACAHSLLQLTGREIEGRRKGGQQQDVAVDTVAVDFVDAVRKACQLPKPSTPPPPLATSTTTTPTTTPTTTTTTAVTTTPQSLPLVIVQLRGEMGNHLSTIAHGVGLQLWLLRDFNVTTSLLLRHQVVVVVGGGGGGGGGESASKSGTQVVVTRDHPKHGGTVKALRRCFPILRGMDFALGGQWTTLNDELATLKALPTSRDDIKMTAAAGQQQQQQQQLQLLQRQILLVDGAPDLGAAETNVTTILSTGARRRRTRREQQPVVATKESIEQGLKAAIDVWNQRRRRRRHRQQRPPKDPNDDHEHHHHHRNLPPFLYSDSMDNMVMVDRFLPEFQALFRMDHTDPACCRSVPDPDEHVFHFRNFAAELSVGPHQAYTFEEASPRQVAHELFAHLSPGERVAIVTRRRRRRRPPPPPPMDRPSSRKNEITPDKVENDDVDVDDVEDVLLQAHVTALRNRGLRVRIIEGQTGLQDFCFMTMGRRTVVGPVRSTFSQWAALLGFVEEEDGTDARKRNVTLYAMDTRALRRRYGPLTLKRWSAGGYQYEYDGGKRILKGHLHHVLLPVDDV